MYVPERASGVGLYKEMHSEQWGIFFVLVFPFHYIILTVVSNPQDSPPISQHFSNEMKNAQDKLLNSYP